MIIGKNEDITDDSDAMGKIFVITALTDKGETALKKIFLQQDSEREKVIMTKGQIITHDEKKLPAERYAIWYKFTSAARLMAKHPGMSGKFKPFTVGAICSKILEGLKAEGASLMDVEIEVIEDATERNEKKRERVGHAGILGVQKKGRGTERKRILYRKKGRSSTTKKRTSRK